MSFSAVKSRYVPKTHGHIVPWDPPPFEIPDQVLHRLALKLEEEVVSLAQADAETMEDASQQSSPQSNPAVTGEVSTLDPLGEHDQSRWTEVKRSVVSQRDT